MLHFDLMTRKQEQAPASPSILRRESENRRRWIYSKEARFGR